MVSLRPYSDNHISYRVSLKKKVLSRFYSCFCSRSHISLFSHVFRNQNFKPVSSSHSSNTHSSIWIAPKRMLWFKDTKEDNVGIFLQKGCGGVTPFPQPVICKNDTATAQTSLHKNRFYCQCMHFSVFFCNLDSEWALFEWTDETGSKFWFQSTSEKVKSDF